MFRRRTRGPRPSGHDVGGDSREHPLHDPSSGPEAASLTATAYAMMDSVPAAPMYAQIANASDHPSAARNAPTPRRL